MQAVKRLLLILSVSAVLLGSYGVGHAETPDVGLVDWVVGDVFYTGSAGTGMAQAFMKMRQGDRFVIAAGAQVRVIYFQDGRRETWHGPASFTSGTAQSGSISGTVHSVANLPIAVPQKIQKIPELIQMTKLGGIRVRGLAPKQQLSSEQQVDVAAARKVYAQLGRQLPHEDITPALYLFAVLQDYLLYDDMKTVVDEMLRKQPGNREAEQLAEWVKRRTDPGS